MATPKASIYVFVTEEDVEQTRRARTLAAGLRRDGWTVREVNRLSKRLDDLLLVAKHRVVVLPRWIVVLDEEVMYDEDGMPTLNQARRRLAQLALSPT